MLSAMLFLFLGSKSDVDPPRQIPSDFKLVLKTQQNQKNGSQGLPKNDKKRPGNSYKTISGGNRFLQYHPCENLDFIIPSVGISGQKSIKNVTWKQARNKNELASFLNPKANIHRSQNHSQIDANPVSDYLVSILPLPWSWPGVPKWRLRASIKGKCHELKWRVVCFQQ